MSSNADKFNELAIEGGRITIKTVTKLTRVAQARLGLEVDGMCGPKTLAALHEQADVDQPAIPNLTIDGNGWFEGDKVERIPIHKSWYYDKLGTIDKQPAAIVAHYTATDHGTGRRMAHRRSQPWSQFAQEWRLAHPGKPVPKSSWQITIEGDGTIIQQASCLVGCWHARGKIGALGAANRTSVGIELVGHGDHFPAAQVVSAKAVWRALTGYYLITRKFAMVPHSALDPERRSDPGPLWMGEYGDDVLDYAFA